LSLFSGSIAFAGNFRASSWESTGYKNGSFWPFFARKLELLAKKAKMSLDFLGFEVVSDCK